MTQIAYVILFHTIMMNSPLRHLVVDDQLRHVDWTREPKPWILTPSCCPDPLELSGVAARKTPRRRPGAG